MVSAFGSSTESVHSTSLDDSPRAMSWRPQPLPDERDHALAALLAGPPDLVVARLGEALPAIGLGLVPLGQHVPGEEVGHLRRHPRVGVHAVGDRADRHLLGGHVGPEVA